MGVDAEAKTALAKQTWLSLRRWAPFPAPQGAEIIDPSQDLQEAPLGFQLLMLRLGGNSPAKSQAGKQFQPELGKLWQ